MDKMDKAIYDTIFLILGIAIPILFERLIVSFGNKPRPIIFFKSGEGITYFFFWNRSKVPLSKENASTLKISLKEGKGKILDCDIIHYEGDKYSHVCMDTGDSAVVLKMEKIGYKHGIAFGIKHSGTIDKECINMDYDPHGVKKPKIKESVLSSGIIIFSLLFEFVGYTSVYIINNRKIQELFIKNFTDFADEINWLYFSILLVFLFGFLICLIFKRNRIIVLIVTIVSFVPFVLYHIYLIIKGLISSIHNFSVYQISLSDFGDKSVVVFLIIVFVINAVYALCFYLSIPNGWRKIVRIN